MVGLNAASRRAMGPLVLGLAWLFALSIFAPIGALGGRPSTINVLMIIADDLRADVAPYSERYSEFTPNIKRFAQTALMFENAYSQQALCGPSRNSFVTGRRPDSLRSHNFLNSFRRFSKMVQTIPQAFKNAGYDTMAIGKVFHVYPDIKDDAAQSWTSTTLVPGSGSGEDQNCLRRSLWCNCDSNTCADAQIANIVVARLKNREKKAKPFFMAVGFRRPHPDFIVEASYPSFSDFPISIAQEQVPFDFDGPQGMPTAAFYTCQGFMQRWQFSEEPMLPWTPVNREMQEQMRLQYWRSAGYMDSQLGLILDTLDQLSLASNTIVIFMSDHGFALGEKNMYCKQSVFEVATRVPLLMRVPWHAETSAGKKTSTIVELVDLFPTLVNLIGSTVPALSINSCADGKDLTPAFKNQDFTKEANNDELGGIDIYSDVPDFSEASFAISQFPRCLPEAGANVWSNPCSSTNDFLLMGYSLRTRRWRYTEWRVWRGTIADWSENGLNSTELYDHAGDIEGKLDFDAMENVNLASRFPQTVAKLSLALRIAVVNAATQKPAQCAPQNSGTFHPTQFPTISPTPKATARPSESPTLAPTKKPTSKAPSKAPTRKPTTKPTKPPTVKQTNSPVIPTTATPTTAKPSTHPTDAPTNAPSEAPSFSSPTFSPSSSPTPLPTKLPTAKPSGVIFKTSSPTMVDNSTTPRVECRDTNAFCAVSDWTCGFSQQCSAVGLDMFVSCPCWQFEEDWATSSKLQSGSTASVLSATIGLLVIMQNLLILY